MIHTGQTLSYAYKKKCCCRFMMGFKPQSSALKSAAPHANPSLWPPHTLPLWLWGHFADFYLILRTVSFTVLLQSSSDTNDVPLRSCDRKLWSITGFLTDRDWVEMIGLFLNVTFRHKYYTVYSRRGVGECSIKYTNIQKAKKLLRIQFTSESFYI